jgi:hypothetical protein
VQVKGTGGNCVVSEVATRIGLDAAGNTYDGRWSVLTAQLTVSATVPPSLVGTINVQGVATKNTDSMSLAFFALPTGVVLRCSTTSLTPPATSTDGEAC